MFRLFLLIFFIQPSSFIHGQFYFFVNDPDSMVNVRPSPNLNSKPLCQLPQGMVVHETSLDSVPKNWRHVEFYLRNEEARKLKIHPEEGIPDVMQGWVDVTGYISKDRLIDIEEQTELRKKDTDDGLIFYNDSAKIIITGADFERKKHKLEIASNHEVKKIDGHYLIGTDGAVPRYAIKSLAVVINNKKIELPARLYSDLYEPNLNRFTHACIDRAGTIYLIMRNGDGAGVYEVIFVIRQNKPVARYVFFGQC